MLANGPDTQSLFAQKHDFGGVAVTQRIALIISAAILAVFLMASALFVLQGGFGGGHGRFDFILYCLSFPWIFLPWPEAVWAKGDFVPIVFIPFLMNCSVFVAVFLATRLRTKSTRPAAEPKR